MIYSVFLGRKRIKLLLKGKRITLGTGLQKLTAPTISLDGDTLTMTATDDRTQEFVIFVDGVETAVVANLISFTIAGTQYKAEAGMTWGEWVDSEYNTGGFYILDTIYGWVDAITNGSKDSSGRFKIVNSNPTGDDGAETTSDTIKNAFNYYLVYTPQSGGGSN